MGLVMVMARLSPIIIINNLNFIGISPPVAVLTHLDYIYIIYCMVTLLVY